MAINNLTEQHLGNIATEKDLEDFKTACRNYHTKHPNFTEDEAIDYIWDNGDFISKMMYWKRQQ
jgi:hypothetical protein